MEGNLAVVPMVVGIVVLVVGTVAVAPGTDLDVVLVEPFGPVGAFVVLSVGGASVVRVPPTPFLVVDDVPSVADGLVCSESLLAFIANAPPPMRSTAKAIAIMMRLRLRFFGVGPVGGCWPETPADAITRVGIDVGIDIGIWTRVGIDVGVDVGVSMGMTMGMGTRSVGRGRKPGSVEV